MEPDPAGLPGSDPEPLAEPESAGMLGMVAAPLVELESAGLPGTAAAPLVELESAGLPGTAAEPLAELESAGLPERGAEPLMGSESAGLPETGAEALMEADPAVRLDIGTEALTEPGPDGPAAGLATLARPLAPPLTGAVEGLSADFSGAVGVWVAADGAHRAPGAGGGGGVNTSWPSPVAGLPPVLSGVACRSLMKPSRPPRAERFGRRAPSLYRAISALVSTPGTDPATRAAGS
jgi:hypothetical protein